MNKSKFIRTVLGVIFLVTGAFLIFYPQLENWQYKQEQKELVHAFEQLGEIKVEASAETSVKLEEENGNASWMKEARGVLSIPGIDLEMLLVNGADAESLNMGAGIIEPEKKIGVQNVGIAGHRGAAYGKQFNRLDEMKLNDEIHVKTASEEFTFKVDRVFTVDYQQVEVLEEKNNPYLTLVTCTPVGAKNPTDRLIVQAKLLNKEAI